MSTTTRNIPNIPNISNDSYYLSINTYNFKKHEWYGIDIYDGGYHFFKILNNKIIYIDSFGDCSAIYNINTIFKKGFIEITEDYTINHFSENFKEEILNYISPKELEKMENEEFRNYIEIDDEIYEQLFPF